MNLASDDYFGKIMPLGRYRCSFRIPKNFLNARRFIIGLSLGEEPNRVDQVVDSILGFQVHDATDNQPGTNVSWEGFMLRPKFAWKTEKLS